MKKFLSITLTFLLAFVIMYAGSGINSYSFCCEDCHSYGAEAIAGHKCSDVHEHECAAFEQEFDENAICEDTHQHCELNRLDLDLQNPLTTSNSQSFIKIPVLKSFLTATLHHLIQESENEPLPSYVSQSQKPPNLCKSVYFSLLETLII